MQSSSEMTELASVENSVSSTKRMTYPPPRKFCEDGEPPKTPLIGALERGGKGDQRFVRVSLEPEGSLLAAGVFEAGRAVRPLNDRAVVHHRANEASPAGARRSAGRLIKFLP